MLMRRKVLVRAGMIGLAFAGLLHMPSVNAKNLPLQVQVQKLLNSFRRDYGFPGATATYVLPDGQIGDTAIGLADVRNGTPMTPATRMLAASIGKTFVGATVIALSRKGRLGLDDPVAEWLGDRNWFSRLPNHDTITVRHLLTHSAGLLNHVESAEFRTAFATLQQSGQNPFEPETLVTFILDQPPRFEAGQGWAYSDTGYILLGMIIEAATDQNYFDVVQVRFLDPLNLSQTSASNRPDLLGLANGYMAADNPFGLPPETTSRPGVMAWNPSIEWSGGGFVSTSHDLAVWGAALFGGRAMDGPYLDELLDSVKIDPDLPGIEYGVGISINNGGPLGPVYGHGGWIPGYSSSLRHYADNSVTIAFQINTDIGIVDDSTQLVPELERSLAELIIASLEAL